MTYNPDEVLREALRKPASTHAINLALAAVQDLFIQGMRSPPITPNPQDADLLPLPKFMKNVTRRSRCTLATMLVAYIYIKRIKSHIGVATAPSNAPDAHHRVVFSATMIAHKLWNDSSMVGKHWAEVSTMFDCKELLKMERDFIHLLRYDTVVSMNEVLRYTPRFLELPLKIVLLPVEDECFSFKEEQVSLPTKPSYRSIPPPPLTPLVQSYGDRPFRKYRPGFF